MEKMCTMSNLSAPTFSITLEQQVHTTSHLCGFQILDMFLKQEENLGLFSLAPIPHCSLSLSSKSASHFLFSLGEQEEAAVVVASWSLIISLVMEPQSGKDDLKVGGGVLTSSGKPEGRR